MSRGGSTRVPQISPRCLGKQVVALFSLYVDERHIPYAFPCTLEIWLSNCWACVRRFNILSHFSRRILELNRVLSCRHFFLPSILMIWLIIVRSRLKTTSHFVRWWHVTCQLLSVWIANSVCHLQAPTDSAVDVGNWWTRILSLAHRATLWRTTL